MLASRRRSRVACVVKRRLTHGPPSCSLVGDMDTWSRESGQGTHGGRGRRGGRPSPAGNTRVFSLTALVLRILMKNIGNLFVRLFVSSLLTFRYFSIIVSLFGAGAVPFFFSGDVRVRPILHLRHLLRT